METYTTGPQNRTFFQEVNDPSLHILGTLWREGHKGSYCFDSQADKQILLFQLNIPGTQNASLKKQYHKTLSCHRSDIRKTTLGSDSPTEATDRCPSPRRATRGAQSFHCTPYRAASSHQHCRSAVSSYPYSPILGRLQG